MNPIIEDKDLPAPRLELRWVSVDTHNHVCDYNLVVPLRAHDLRREGGDGNDVREVQTTRIGQTRMNGPAPLREYQGETWIEPPFRDGAHAKWDAELLKLPVYVTADGKAQLIKAGG